MYESLNSEAQRHTHSYQFSQPNHRPIFSFGPFYVPSDNCCPCNPCANHAGLIPVLTNNTEAKQHLSSVYVI